MRMTVSTRKEKLPPPGETSHIQKSSPRRLPISLLKKCVVLSPPHDRILSWVLLPAVQLAHGKPLGLLPAMVCDIQRSLRALIEAFCRPPATKRGKGQVLPRDGPCPRVEMPYTYLMVRFALHYPAIIQPREELPEGVRFAHLRSFGKS